MINPKIPNVGTQKAWLIFFLLNGDRFQSRDMWDVLNTGQAGARISELRADGWDIEGITRSIHSKEKTYFMRHSYISRQMTQQNVCDFMTKMSLLNQAAA